jgi:phosphonate metabolism-associated iron-containing alcohol dehydrogenase
MLKMNAIWTYLHRTKIVFGAKSLERLGAEAETFGAKRVLLVTGASSMRKSGALGRALEMLGRKRVTLFEGVPSNPPLSTVDDGARMAISEDCDLIVALGGGSAMDVAKAISMLARTDGTALDFFDRRIEVTLPCIPTIAIPTTAGTGSEVNGNMVATDPEREMKLALAIPAAFPKVAILDPELTLSLPKNQTASTGLDALSHAFECYWNKNASPVTDIYSLEAIRLIFEWLPIAVLDGGNTTAREKMLYASMVASFGFGSTGTGACHAISYPLTVRWGLDHGFACAFTMPEMLERNWDAFGAERRHRMFDAMGAQGANEAVEKLRRLTIEMGTPATLSEIGVPEEEIETIPDGIPQRVLNNTVVAPDWDEIVTLLKSKK